MSASATPPGLTLERFELRIGRQRIRYYTVGRYDPDGLWRIFGSAKRKREALERAWQRYDREQRA